MDSNPVLQEKLSFCAVACLRAPYDAQAAAQARACLADPAFPWPAFVQLAHNERIAPLLHYHLAGRDLLPPQAAESFQRAYLQNAWINAERLDELARILDRFHAAGIPVTLLKGAALMSTLYAKSALRPMLDMDVLIPAEGMEMGQQILLEMGYECPLPLVYSGDFITEVGLQKLDHPYLKVDLHSSLLAPPHQLSAAQLEWFSKNTAPVEVKGYEARSLMPAAQLLYLSAHLWLHHGRENLLNLNDIYLVLYQYHGSIDWDEVLATAVDFDLVLPLKSVLVELSKHWAAPVPRDVLERLGQVVPSAREKRKFRAKNGEPNTLSALLADTLSYPDWQSRFRFARSMLFPSSDFMMKRFRLRSPLLIPFFYAYRLARRAVLQMKKLFFA